ncbi:MAG TPA: SurA N-terminal domain-containing protein [Candidatus Methylomirabilis sp.]
MLKTMREGSAVFVKGVMVVVVVTFVGTIFMVWGVGSTPGDLGRRGVAAVVGNIEIPVNEYREAYSRQVETYKQLFGDKFDEKLLESLNLKQQVLDRLIRRALIQQYAERKKLMVGPDELTTEIQQIPAFGGKDGFSRQRYLAVLKANNFTAERFEREMGRDLTERKVESLIRDSVKVSEAEAREIFQQVRRQLTVEVAQLPAGDDGKKLAETISVAVGKGKTLSAASQEAGALVKTYGPFPATAPPQGIPDPEAFRQAAIALRAGEMSPLVTGQKASYLLRLESQQEPSTEEFEKEKPTFRTQVLLGKREAVVADWVLQLRQTAKVVVEPASL